MMPRRLALLTAMLMLLWSAPALADEPAGWKAGAARAAITPSDPIWMAGYASRDHPSESVLHDIWAKALVLEDPAGQRVALVTLDLCGISRDLSDPIRDRIQEAHGLGRDRVSLACSHTHSAPVAGENLIGMYPLDEAQARRIRDYAAMLAETVVKIVGQAVERIEPASLSWGVGHCDFAVNRRNNNQNQAEELRAQLALNGPVDHDVPVLAVSGADGQLRTVVFGYACHCTTLSDYQISGDYAGFAQNALEAAHPGAQAMFFAGCGGDQNPLPRRTVEQAERYGKALADSVERVLGGSRQPIAGELATSYREIDLAFGAIPERAHWEQAAESTNLAERNRARRLLAQLDRGEPIATTYPYPVQVWRLGDGPLWILLGGEVTVDYALRLKGNLGTSRTWVAAYCNDVMAYIPSRRVLEEGGYEGGGAMVYYGHPAPWSDQVEEQVVEAVRQGVEAARPAAGAN